MATHPAGPQRAWSYARERRPEKRSDQLWVGGRLWSLTYRYIRIIAS